MSAPPPHLPPALPGSLFELGDSGTGRMAVYAQGEQHPGQPLLLIHSVNAAACAFEVRPLYLHYAASRPTYAVDLPGYGLSERSDRTYTPRLMTDAVHLATREIRRRHGETPISALAVSLSCEFLARAAGEDPGAYQSVALVSPTGFSGTKRREGPPGSTRFVPALSASLRFGLWDDGLFNTLTRPSVIRYFLERTWGGKNIDEALWAYDVLTTRQPGAKYAPFDFLSARLFSNDVNRLYDALVVPVWMTRAVRGDFKDYRGASAMESRANWHLQTFDAGALPYFEVLAEFVAAYDAFLAVAETAPRPAT